MTWFIRPHRTAAHSSSSRRCSNDSRLRSPNGLMRTRPRYERSIIVMFPRLPPGPNPPLHSYLITKAAMTDKPASGPMPTLPTPCLCRTGSVAVAGTGYRTGPSTGERHGQEGHPRAGFVRRRLSPRNGPSSCTRFTKTIRYTIATPSRTPSTTVTRRDSRALSASRLGARTPCTVLVPEAVITAYLINIPLGIWRRDRDTHA